MSIVAVLGNQDHHSGREDEVRAILSASGIIVLDRDHVVLDVAGVDVGIVGTKGFVGGFPGAEIADFGESLLRAVFAETSREARSARFRCGTSHAT